jgi:hypothetical protein
LPTLASADFLVGGAAYTAQVLAPGDLNRRLSKKLGAARQWTCCLVDGGDEAGRTQRGEERAGHHGQPLAACPPIQQVSPCCALTLTEQSQVTAYLLGAVLADVHAGSDRPDRRNSARGEIVGERACGLYP